MHRQECQNSECMKFFSSFCPYKAAVCDLHDDWIFICRKKSNKPNFLFPQITALVISFFFLSFFLFLFLFFGGWGSPEMYILFCGSITDNNTKQFICSHFFPINKASDNPKEMVYHCKSNCSHSLQGKQACSPNHPLDFLLLAKPKNY